MTKTRAPMARPLTADERAELAASAPVARLVCEVCHLARPADEHPCRFEAACSCWYGTPCRQDGDPRD